MVHLRSLSRVLLGGAVLALVACQDSTGARAGPAAHLDVVGGNAQTAPVLTELPQPVVVKVTDEKGHAVKGHIVNFVVTAGGGKVFAGAAITNDDGIAQERWTLGPVAGPQTLEARAVDSSTGQALVFATFSAVATAGPPAQTEPTGASATSGDTVVSGVVGSVVEDSFGVLVRDAVGNPAPGVQVAWTVTSGGGSITSPTTTDASGVARTQWVLGSGTGPVQTAAATVAGATVRFSAYPAHTLAKAAGDGLTAAAGSPVTVTVKATGGSGPIGDLPIHWTVAPGGGSVTPAVSVTRRGSPDTYGTASATWTVGGTTGTQTLTATAGGLSVTFTASVLGAGQRTLLAQLPAWSTAIDATTDRVLWMESVTRVIRVRTLSNGADAMVKTDTAKKEIWTVTGHLYTGGALLWNPFRELFDWHGGTATYLGQTAVNEVAAVDGDWASYYLHGPGLIRRNLAAAATTVISGGTAVSDVGPDGTLVYPTGSSLVTVTPGGATSSVPAQSPSCGGIERVFTDGVNAGYICATATFSRSAWLSKPGGDELLTSVNYFHGDQVSLMLAGGWVAYGNTGTGAVSRRAPNGTKTQLNAGSKAKLMALSPSGAVVYAMNDQYYKVAANGTTVGVGPVAGAYERVVWRGDRFLLLSGSAVYDLGS